jgi:hypothetical protein
MLLTPSPRYVAYHTSYYIGLEKYHNDQNTLIFLISNIVYIKKKRNTPLNTQESIHRYPNLNPKDKTQEDPTQKTQQVATAKQ